MVLRAYTDLFSCCSVRIRKNITFLGQLFSNKLSTVISSGIEISDLFLYVVFHWKNSCTLEYPLLFRRNPLVEVLGGISCVNAEHSCVFFA